MPFDLIIFDCDGVLVDSEPIANRVLREMLETDAAELRRAGAVPFTRMADLVPLLGLEQSAGGAA